MNLKSIRGTHVTIGGIITAASIMAAVWAYADDLGFQIDKPAWQSDILVLAQAVQALQQSADQRELFRLRQLEDDLILKIATAESKGERSSPLDILKLQQIRRQIDDLRKQE